MKKAYFAGGCFWCTEAIFQMIKGVSKVTSGYAGGNIDSPSYEQVSTGSTGHTEAIEITYDPDAVDYSDLLYIFFKTHDPTTLDQQGADVGPQYRSAIFYTDDEQKTKAQKEKAKAQKDYKDSIVTEILPLKDFYEAEGYHQDYYNKNKNESYCRVVIDPKIQKLKENYGKYIKKSS